MLTKLSKLLISILIIYIAWIREMFGDIKIILYGTVLLTAALIVLDMLLRKNYNLLRVQKLVVVFFAFGLYALVSGVFVAKNISSFTSSMITYFAYCIVCYEVWYVSDVSGSIGWVLKALKFTALLCAVQTIFFGVDYYNGIIVTTMSKNNNPNHLGIVMIAGIFATAVDKKSLSRFFVADVVALLLMCYTIILSGSRKCFIIAFLIIALWAVVFLKEIRAEKSFARMLAVTIIVVASAVFVANYALNGFTTTAVFYRLKGLLYGDGADSRIQLYKAAVNYWKSSPIVGIGFDQFKVNYYRGFFSHSTYAEALACTGIIGCLVLFVPLLKKLFVLARKTFKSEGDTRFCLFVTLVMLVSELLMALGQVLFYELLHMIVLQCVFWLADYGEIDRSCYAEAA